MPNGGGPRWRAWGASFDFLIDGADATVSAWIADRCGRNLGEEFFLSGVKGFAAFVREAKARGLAAWREFDVFRPANECAPRKQGADSRQILTLEVVDGRATVEARSVAEGSQGLIIKDGMVCCASVRPSRLRVFPLSAVKTWKLPTVGSQSALLQSVTLGVAFNLRAPAQ